MFREIQQQLKILMAQLYNYTKLVVDENEILRKEITKLKEENERLRNIERSPSKSN